MAATARTTPRARCSDAKIGRADATKLLEYAETGDTVIVWRINRLDRSRIDVLNTVELLRAGGIHARSLSDGIDPATSTGRLMLATLAEYEHELIAEVSTPTSPQRANRAPASDAHPRLGCFKGHEHLESLAALGRYVSHRRIHGGDRVSAEPAGVRPRRQCGMGPPPLLAHLPEVTVPSSMMRT